MNKKKRWLYFVLILLIIPAGLGTRSYAAYLPGFIAMYGGDVLYATLIFFGIRFCFPAYTLIKVAVISYIICIAIETFQLYKAPWIEKIRHTPPFGLLLGFGFLWSDWVCYFVGVLLAWLIGYFLENIFFAENKKAPHEGAF